MKMRRSAVMVQSRLVDILLVNENRAALPLHEVGNITDAPWFLPRRRGKVAQNLTNVVPVCLIKRHPYDKTQHSGPFLLYAFSAWSNSGNIMVWSRSGPVETIPILAPDSFSRNKRYSWASVGSLSNSVIPSVEAVQPFNFV